MGATMRLVRPSAVIIAAWALLAILAGNASAIDFPGPDPGPARAAIQGDTMTLENNVLRFTWSTAGARLKPKEFVDKLNGKTLTLSDSECFCVVLEESPSNTRSVKASQLRLLGEPEIPPILPSAEVRVRSDGLSYPRFDGRVGKQVVVDLYEGGRGVRLVWVAALFDGDNYVLQRVQLVPRGRRESQISEVAFGEFGVPGARPTGSVDGCPVVAGDIFFASESPLAKHEIRESASVDGKRTHVRSAFPIDAGEDRWESVGARFVMGVSPHGHLRRGFLYYLERERACPYRPFLHYNNGSEIGCDYWGKRLHKTAAEAEQFRMNQQELWLRNIRAIGDELVKKRKVKLDAFVHDFEWDDETLVWQFHRGYPNGFCPAADLASHYGARVGVWFSPWGGYPCQPARVKFGREMGFETSPGGLSLAGPRYYRRFSTACANMIRQYGANYFKFDGFAAGNNQPGAGPYVSDVEALLRLAKVLHGPTARIAGKRDERDVFINATTGSWPSPFWLLHVDSIWRQGNDTGMLGKGSDRQRWITYRDNEVYHRIVKQSPLFPLNSLMIHGVFVNELPFEGDPYDPKNPRASVVAKDVIDEIHTFFGTGTGCQEMYIHPKLMTAELWDALAEAAIWSRKNSDVLVDTHWIGGDPAKAEIYGFASWSKRQGIFTLRNPDDKPAQIALDVGQAFELPQGAPTRYSLKSPWKRDAARPAVQATAGKPHTFSLAPFEVLVFEAVPSGG